MDWIKLKKSNFWWKVVKLTISLPNSKGEGETLLQNWGIGIQIPNEIPPKKFERTRQEWEKGNEIEECDGEWPIIVNWARPNLQFSSSLFPFSLLPISSSIAVLAPFPVDGSSSCQRNLCANLWEKLEFWERWKWATHFYLFPTLFFLLNFDNFLIQICKYMPHFWQTREEKEEHHFYFMKTFTNRPWIGIFFGSTNGSLWFRFWPILNDINPQIHKV